MKLSIIIPCYNEKETIVEIVRRVRAVDMEKEIIVVDDCSTDGTREELEKLGDQIDKRILKPVNQGKGAAVRDGIAQASGDYVLIQDADLEYDPNDYFKLIKPLDSGLADVVFGSRFTGGESHRVFYFWHSMGNRFLTMLSNMFTNLNLTDMEVGYKVFRSSIIKNIIIQENRFGFEPEITAKVARAHCRIYEVGVSYMGRTYFEGKKINWKDGIRALYCIFRYNFFK